MFPLSRVLQRACALYADHTAVVDGDERLSYATLAARASQLASALLGLGLERGDRVAILDYNSARFLELHFACAQAGLVLVPLNYRLTGSDIAYMLGDAGVRVVFVGSAFLGLVEAARDAGAQPEHVFVLAQAADSGVPAYQELLTTANQRSDFAVVAPDDVALIYYTSGSTGVPKGVSISSANSYFGALDGLLALRLGGNDVWMHTAPLFHMASGMFVWALPMVGGCQVASAFEPATTLATMETERVTATAAPMTIFSMLAEQQSPKQRNLSALRHLVYGGATTPQPLVERCRDAFGPVLAHVYAMTECTGFATLLGAEEHVADRNGGAWHNTSAGKPVELIDLRIVDGDGDDVATDGVGEIIVSGPKITQGYWGRPTETAAAIRDGWFYSGDLGRRDEDGYVYIVDRKNDMIKSGGESIYPIEIEAVIAADPSVMEVAVIGVPDDRWGEAVTAIVVPRAGLSINVKALTALCRERLAGYKVPKSFELRDEPFPKTGPGKIAKRKLREPYWAGHKRNV